MADGINNMTPADLAAITNGSKNSFGSNGGIWWFLILFLFMAMGGGFMRNNQMPAQPMSAVNTQNDIQRGFDQSALQGALAGISAQMGNDRMNLFQTLTNNQNQITNGMNTLAMGLQQVGYQANSGLADLKYTVAQENCNDRQTLNLGMRDLMAQNTGNTNMLVQTIQSGFREMNDKFCDVEKQGLKQQISDLQNKLNLATLTASQQLQSNQIVSQVRPFPQPAYIVSSPYTGGSTTTTAG